MQNPPRPIPTPVTAPGHNPPPNHPGTGGGMSHRQQSVFDLMKQTLASWGLGSLTSVLRRLIVHGDTSTDTLALELSQTKEYKQRFAGNAERVKNGLAELTPAAYIGLEEQYRNILQAYGMPKGFFDNHTDFVKLIGGDVSPGELQTRAQIAHDQYTAAPQYVRDLWSQYFGSSGDAIAAILDPKVATQVIQDRSTQVAIGGAAAQVGLGVGHGRAQQLQQAGVTLDSARKAYQFIAQALPTDQQIAHRFGTQFGQRDEENDLLLGDAKAGLKRQSLYDEERGLFGGGSGATQASIGVNQDH